MNRTIAVLVFTMASAALLGCPQTKEQEKPIPKDATTTTTAAAERAKENTGPAPTGNGVVTGTVSVTGKLPVMLDIKDRKSDPICARVPMKYNDVVVDKDHHLQDVLVRLAPSSIKGRFPTPADVILEQKECMYTPHTFGIQSGGNVIVRNDDKTTHNVHTYLGNESLFNQGQPPGTPDIRLPEKGKTFDEGVITFKCDIHRWMNAYGVVTDHPFFTVTQSDGSFRLDKIPPGKYKLEAWHSVFGSKSQDIDVVEGKPLRVTFSFNADTDKRAE